MFKNLFDIITGNNSLLLFTFYFFGEVLEQRFVYTLATTLGLN